MWWPLLSAPALARDTVCAKRPHLIAAPGTVSKPTVAAYCTCGKVWAELAVCQLRLCRHLFVRVTLKVWQEGLPIVVQSHASSGGCGDADGSMFVGIVQPHLQH